MAHPEPLSVSLPDYMQEEEKDFNNLCEVVNDYYGLVQEILEERKIERCFEKIEKELVILKRKTIKKEVCVSKNLITLLEELKDFYSNPNNWDINDRLNKKIPKLCKRFEDLI